MYTMACKTRSCSPCKRTSMTDVCALFHTQSDLLLSVAGLVIFTPAQNKVAAYACNAGLARTGHTASAVGTKVVILGGHGTGHPVAMDVLIVHLDTLRITR